MRMPFLFSCLEGIVFNTPLLWKHKRLLSRLLDWFDVRESRISRWSQGFRIECDLSVVFERAIYLGLYDLPELAVVERLLTGKGVFIDCGANLGGYSLYAANKLRSNSSVISLEPNPEVFPRLTANIRLNGFGKYVEAHAVALSDQEGTAKLWIPSYTHTIASLAPDKVKDPDATYVEVPLKTLDSILGERKMEGMKIDAEGHELAILKGSEQTLQRDSPWLLLECDVTIEQSLSLENWPVHRFLATMDYQAFEISDLETPLDPPEIRKSQADAINLLYRIPES